MDSPQRSCSFVGRAEYHENLIGLCQARETNASRAVAMISELSVFLFLGLSLLPGWTRQW